MRKPTVQKNRIIIVGAGAAGLMAARELSSLHEVVILEASGALGGRISTVNNSGFGKPVESGAEFMHGNLPITGMLLKQAGISYTEVEGDAFQVAGGQWEKQEEMIEGWDELLKRMETVEQDITMTAFLEKHFAQEKYEALRKHIKRFVQGFDVADMNTVSVKELYNEWSNEGEKNYRIDGGYAKLIDFLSAECRKNQCVIHVSSPVTRIKWEKGNVIVYTKGNREFRSDKIIITVPAGILQNRREQASIEFSPALTKYITAAKNIGFGSVVKLTLLFKNRFWEEKQKHAGFILTDEPIPTWWTQLPDNIPMLTGWLGGPPAAALRDADDDHIVELALESLSRIFQLAPLYLQSVLVDSHVQNWGRQEWTMGAYSYSTPESAEARKKLNVPVADTVYFAGEALYEGTSPGTVEAALSSGKAVAGKIRGN